MNITHRALIIADTKFWVEEAAKFIMSKEVVLPTIHLATSTKADPGVFAPARLEVSSPEFAKLWAKSYSMIISLHCKEVFHPDLVKETICVNIHPGLLPHQRGWAPYFFAMLRGEPAGACIHVMDEEIDHGPVIEQQEVEVCPWDTCDTVYQKVREVERQFLWSLVPQLVWFNSKKDIPCRAPFPDPQPRPMTKEDFEAVQNQPIANWKELSAEELLCHMRARTFGKDCRATIREEGKLIRLGLSIEEVHDAGIDGGAGELGQDGAAEEDRIAAEEADCEAEDLCLEQQPCCPARE